MANIIWQVRTSLSARLLPGFGYRGLKQSAPVWKKTATTGRADDFFAEDDDAGDLFSVRKPGSSSALEVDTVAALAETTSPSEARVVDGNFDRHYKHVTDTLSRRMSGTEKGSKDEDVRRNSVMRLLHHTTKKDQLLRVVELFPAWRNSGRKIDVATAENIIDVCLLHQPRLLVDIFSKRPEYGVDIPNLPTARRILHALVTSRPFTAPPTFASGALQHATAFAALFPLHALPHATHDTTSLALLLQACARDTHGTESHAALLALLPSLLKKLRATRAPKPALPWGRWTARQRPEYALRPRRAGYTQTPAVEWYWVTLALFDAHSALVRSGSAAAKEVEGVLRERLGVGADAPLRKAIASM